MAKLNEVYRCNICGNIVEVLQGGKGQLVCCGENMELLEENTKDASLEKHVPVKEVEGDKVTVTVGSAEHPMDDDHYITWIEVLVDDKVYRQNLKPGDKPVAVFNVSGSDIKARAYCNLHDLWST
ncbi:desulfoferrodoxin [Natranaerofaba carboxydovora]|uniref:desulfoferrodoxin n=1 Tax=Natranaerofaba carboxydovora TaxID=2742683 RepID=UPI001F143CDB|nr:desulfoferrodoxin [Natranaerofaba carboxydovora]UMZ74441.1 Desulfoferrodoxin [Natranaerofaba carboxydovora]